MRGGAPAGCAPPDEKSACAGVREVNVCSRRLRCSQQASTQRASRFALRARAGELARRRAERGEATRKEEWRCALALDGGELLLVCARLPGGLAAALRLVAAPDEQPLLLEAPVREARAHEVERAARPEHHRLDEREHVGQRGSRAGRRLHAERRVQLRALRVQLRLRLLALRALRHLLCTPRRTNAHMHTCTLHTELQHAHVESRST